LKILRILKVINFRYQVWGKILFSFNKRQNKVSPTGAVATGKCGAPRVTEPRNGGNVYCLFLSLSRQLTAGSSAEEGRAKSIE